MPSICTCALVALTAACFSGTLCYFWAWHSGYQQGWEVARGWPADYDFCRDERHTDA